MNKNELEKGSVTEELVDGDTLIEELRAETQLLDDADDEKQEPVQEVTNTQIKSEKNKAKVNDALNQ